MATLGLGLARHATTTAAGAISAPMETITIVNLAGVLPSELARLKRALLWQANVQLRPIWHTPRV